MTGYAGGIDHDTPTPQAAARSAEDGYDYRDDPGYTSAADLAADEWFDDGYGRMVPCGLRGCPTPGIRFWGRDTLAYQQHVAEGHAGPCAQCGDRKAAGRRPTDGMPLCWPCAEHTDLVPMWATSGDAPRLWRPTGAEPTSTPVDLGAAFNAVVQQARR